MTEHTVESFLGVTVDLEKKKQIRILHVDEDSLKITEQCLKMHGQFLVDSVLSVEEAFQKLEKTKYA